MILDKNPFDDYFIETSISEKVNRYKSEILRFIDYVNREPNHVKLKTLTWLYDKIKNDLTSYIFKTNYFPNYEPTNEEIERFMPQPNVNQYDDALLEECLQIGYEEACKHYEETHKEESKGYDLLLKLIDKLSKQIFEMRYFEQIVNIANETTVNNQDTSKYSPLLLSMFKDNKKILDSFLSSIKNKKGRAIAREVSALLEMKLIDSVFNYKSIYNELKSLGYDMKTYSNFNDGLNIEKSSKASKGIAEIKAKYMSI